MSRHTLVNLRDVEDSAPKLGVDAKLGDNPLDQRQSGREVRTVLDMEHRDHQARHLVVLQQ